MNSFSGYKKTENIMLYKSGVKQIIQYGSHL